MGIRMAINHAADEVLNLLTACFYFAPLRLCVRKYFPVVIVEGA